MSTAVLTEKLEINSFADTALSFATRFWFAVTVFGQLAFGLAVATFYSRAEVRGDSLAWNRFMTHGYIPGDRAGNLVAATHVIAAVIIMLAGAVQLIPQVRRRFPVFHRWNGRIYMLVAVTTSVAGLYMTFARGSIGDLSQHLGGALNAVLIWVCAAMALRYALARDFRTHRRWALRLFLVVSAAWFFRIGFFLWMLIFRAPVGFDPVTFMGPFPTTMSYAQYLLPLAILEIYFRTQDSEDAARRMAMAFGLLIVSVAMAAGIFGVTMFAWLPSLQAPFVQRKSIADTLGATIASRGLNEALREYQSLKATHAVDYNFDEEQLNSLGYELLRTKQYKDAIRVLQLNAEAFPQSGNVYDSLAEAYFDEGNKQQAIANYRKSLELNPKNTTAARMLQKLNAP